MKKVVIICISVILCSSLAFAQKSNEELVYVKGTVTAFDSFLVKNVEIIAKKSKSRVLTDSLGRFEIMAESGDMLSFRANGFEKNRRKVIEDADPVNVNMILMKGKKNKQIAVGYGHMNEDDITYALDHYSDLNRDYMMYNSMFDLLQSELMGAHVVDQNGIKVFLRGSENVLGLGHPDNDHAALFILDGMAAHSVDHLNPGDIKSLTLLKGPESAIYGSRGAYGAVLIQTK